MTDDTTAYLPEPYEPIPRDKITQVLKILGLNPSVTEAISINQDAVTVTIQLSRVPLEERENIDGPLTRPPRSLKLQTGTLTTNIRVPIKDDPPFGRNVTPL